MNDATVVVFVKELVDKVTSQFRGVLGFLWLSCDRERNSRLTSAGALSWFLAAGDYSDDCRPEHGAAGSGDASLQRDAA
jgi:hypothetical protein